jgi:hypothetical protein
LPLLSSSANPFLDFRLDFVGDDRDRLEDEAPNLLEPLEELLSVLGEAKL